MNLKKKIKGFFTLTRKADGGFTLVELIVVIAILAILAGVAVPAYSGYMGRANKAADQTTISDVKQALELYYYSHPSEVTTLGVILNQEGTAPVFAGDATQQAQAQEALAAVFGSAETIGLKYADWEGESSPLSYADSSYKGNESGLISVVDSLTSALGNVVEGDAGKRDDIFGTEFKGFLADYGVSEDDGKAVGNAAVLYVAQKTQGKNDAVVEAFNTGISKGGNATDIVGNVFMELQSDLGYVASMAAIYAYAEGYAQATNQADAFHANTDWSNVKDVNSALAALGESFNNLDPAGFEQYAKEQGNKDLQAYIDMMGTVHTNAGIVSGNLNAEDCFTDGSVENLLKGHAAMSDLGVTTAKGQVAVVLAADNGVILTHVTPMDWNK